MVATALSQSAAGFQQLLCCTNNQGWPQTEQKAWQEKQEINLGSQVPKAESKENPPLSPPPSWLETVLSNCRSILCPFREGF